MSKPTRYPWHIAPAFAVCAATDADGGRWWHEVMPVIDGSHWLSDGVIKSASGRGHRSPDINWRDSLEMRPEAPERDVKIPAETAAFISGLMHGSVDNLQCHLLTIKHLGVLDAAIQVSKHEG